MASRPAIEINEAALIQSAAVAMPLSTGCTAAGYIKFFGGTGTRPNGNAEIERKEAPTNIKLITN